MKKVNLINKKITATGLATSLLATSLCATPCFAYKTNKTSVNRISTSQSRTPLQSRPVSTIIAAGTVTEKSSNENEPNKENEEIKNSSQALIPNKIEKAQLSLSEANCFELTENVAESEEENKSSNESEPNKENEEVKNNLTTSSTDSFEEIDNEEENNSTLQSQANNETGIIAQACAENETNQENKSIVKKNKSISKAEMAKTVAKVVAAAAIAGTAAYFGYKYRAPIAEVLTKGGSYITNKTSSVYDSCKNTLNEKLNQAELTSKFTSISKSFNKGRSYITNKTSSVYDSCKNFFGKTDQTKIQTSFNNSTCPLNQSEMWKCPSDESTSFFNQLKNGTATKLAFIAETFNKGRSYIANKTSSAYDSCKNFFGKTNQTEFPTNPINATRPLTQTEMWKSLLSGDKQYTVYNGDKYIPSGIATLPLDKLILPDSTSLDRFKSTDALVPYISNKSTDLVPYTFNPANIWRTPIFNEGNSFNVFKFPVNKFGINQSPIIDFSENSTTVKNSGTSFTKFLNRTAVIINTVEACLKEVDKFSENSFTKITDLFNATKACLKKARTSSAKNIKDSFQTMDLTDPQKREAFERGMARR